MDPMMGRLQTYDRLIMQADTKQHQGLISIQRQIRARGHTQEELAKAWGVRPSQVSRFFKRGTDPEKMSFNRLAALAAVTDWAPETLLKLLEDSSAVLEAAQAVAGETDAGGTTKPQEPQGMPRNIDVSFANTWRALADRYGDALSERKQFSSWTAPLEDDRSAKRFSFTTQHDTLTVTVTFTETDPARHGWLRTIAYRCAQTLTDAVDAVLKGKNDE